MEGHQDRPNEIPNGFQHTLEDYAQELVRRGAVWPQCEQRFTKEMVNIGLHSGNGAAEDLFDVMDAAVSGKREQLDAAFENLGKSSEKGSYSPDQKKQEAAFMESYMLEFSPAGLARVKEKPRTPYNREPIMLDAIAQRNKKYAEQLHAMDGIRQDQNGRLINAVSVKQAAKIL